jgi:NAD(P)-dependent dehydrogenase (short-subunit alcohol dehydrogenase family)
MKTILITGASGFLGQATVSLFLEKGYKIIGIVHSDKSKDELPSNPALQVVVADLTNEDEITSLINKLVNEYRTIDACVLLAGGYASGDIKTTTVEAIRQQIQLNFETAYTIAKALFPYFMLNKNGRIVLIGSQPPLMPKKAKMALPYSLSKSLLFHLADILNEEAKGTNVVTAVVVPSTINTEANRRAMPNADASKWVKPEQIAQAIEFLISDAGAALREPVLKVYNEVV